MHLLSGAPTLSTDPVSVGARLEAIREMNSTGLHRPCAGGTNDWKLWHGVAHSLQSLLPPTQVGLYVLGPGRVSDETLAKLRNSQPKAEIERRSEACLGIAGGMHPKGLMAQYVQPNSAAGRAGIQPQDVIMELADQPVPDFETYREVMVPLKPGEKVKMKVWRDGEAMSVALKLGRWE